MTGSVSTSGRSRWSRSVANPTTSVANHARTAPGASASPPNRAGSTANANAPNAAQTTVRQPTARPAGNSVARAPASGSRAGRRGRRDRPTTAKTPTADERHHGRGSASARRDGTSSGSAPSRPGQRQLDERRVGHAGRAARRPRRRLPEVAGAADVEVDPRHRPNSRRNMPLFTSEPSAEPEFRRSPYQLSISVRYSSTSGICQ